jgi:hypothetical protein
MTADSAVEELLAPFDARRQLDGERLANHLASVPRDLAAHVHRLDCLQLRAAGSHALAAALLDLKVALDGKGQPLLCHLLARHRAEFDDANLLEELTACIEGTLQAEVLAGRYAFDTVLVWPQLTAAECVRERAARIVDADAPLAMAREMINTGQLDLAFMYFDEALRAAPNDARLAAEAIELCLGARDAEHLAVWRSIAAAANATTLPLWDDAAGVLQLRLN